jgi:hypothetical protein
MRRIVVVSVVALFSVSSYAHSGGTDANGCHTDSSTGSYHCHSTGSSGGIGGGPVSTEAVVMLTVSAAMLIVPLFLPAENADGECPGYGMCLKRGAWYTLLVGGIAGLLASVIVIGIQAQSN